MAGPAAMPSLPRASLRWGLLALALVSMAAGWSVYQRQEPTTTPPSPWDFRSVRSYEDTLTARDESILNANDGLLGQGPLGSDSCYAFLQDETKLEEDASVTEDGDVGHGHKKVAGIQLYEGEGRVRMVIVCAPEPLDLLQTTLRASNTVKVSPDERLERFKTLLSMPGMPSPIQVYHSRWYRLTRNPVPAPGAAATGPIDP